MGVPLQLILGILLILSACSSAKEANLRPIREAPPPTPIQNVTEINNRDLNKIINVNSKTEILDSKLKLVNNVNSFESFPPRLAEAEEQNGKKNATQVEQNSSDNVNGSTKVIKEKIREENLRAINIDSAKFWSNDFHNKNNDVFTLPPPIPPDIQKIHDSSDLLFGDTRHPSFDTNSELTTPTTKLFDEKFKETVESVEQKLEALDSKSSEEKETDEEESKDEELYEEHDPKGPENGSLEIIKSKTIVNNETVDKNSKYKELKIEKIKKINFENRFNESNSYELFDDQNTKGDTAELPRTTEKVAITTSESTTRKSSLLKESVKEKTNLHILSNNIETETSQPFKSYSSSTLPSTTKKQKGEVNDFPALTTTTTTEKLSTVLSSTTISTTTADSRNISDQENHVIPLIFGSDHTQISTTSNSLEATEPSELEILKENHTINLRTLSTENYAIEEVASTTEEPKVTTTDIFSTTLLSEETTTVIKIDSLLENSTDDTKTSDTLETSTSTVETTTIVLELSTIDESRRTPKNLNSQVVNESTEKIELPVLKELDENIPSTLKNEIDTTTVEDTKAPPTLEETTAKEVETTESETTTWTSEIETSTAYRTRDLPYETRIVNEEKPSSTVQKIIKVLSTMVTLTTIKNEESPETTTEYAFVHIGNESNHTTLLPENLSPNFTYSTQTKSSHEPGKVQLFESVTASVETSSQSASTNAKAENVTMTSDNGTETTPTENSFTKDDNEGGGGGKIAAIVISTVGAVCLILLAGLLYVMKKRQRRLNYGPRCRPVSLDDYSIDNLSVYNSVRRKGGARMSKRSFGNPAFEDPGAPTHPLNFPALAKFSTNFEDIRAEFEDVPQISARTSELPEGCETKNRYANVIPLPETRVYLNPIEGYPNSDYINANYVTGPKDVKGYYIATQGPMQNSIDDFWRMVWEQQSKVILMLTHLVENNLEKCVDYLPESEVLNCNRVFGDFQIVLKKREVKEKYIISSLQLKNMVSNSWREVTHFWYRGWPEKGVPDEANSLIAFLIEARSYMKTATIDKRDGLNGIQNGGPPNDHHPVVVHCSPGTGRTGVAIACDIAIREFETTRLVDIPKIVYKIRRDRAGAVQTKEQYIFIYKVVSLYATKLTGGALDNF